MKRQCTKCEGWFSETHFVPNKGWCQKCRKDYMREWRNRPKVKAKRSSKRKEWANSPKGKAWLTTYNREQKRKQRARERQGKKDSEA